MTNPHGGYFWKTTPLTREAIVSAYIAGRPCKDIAHEHGVSHSYISVLARQYGAAMRVSNRRARKPREMGTT
jgi:hypothetical protein